MKHFIREKLANGMEIFFYDLSRKLAGDRWLVSVRCQASIPIDTEFWKTAAVTDPELRAEIQQAMGDGLLFAVSKERYFIDEQLKDDVLAELVSRIKTNMMSYLEKPVFPRRLFEREYMLAEKKIGQDRQRRDYFREQEKEIADIDRFGGPEAD